MEFKITTKVGQDYKTVFSKFDLYFFKLLKPPLIGFKVNRFDGCEPGDEVHVEINTFGWKQEWKALIIEKTETNNEIYFIDEGLQLPRPLKKWRHKHIIAKFIDSSIIIDNIAYSTNSIFLDILLYPVMYLQFFLRKGVYKSYFKK
jgi:ligand-binding SRPBCC domain-containing protein